MRNVEKNALVVAMGPIRNATKLQVVTIGLGNPDNCKELSGVFKHNPDGTTSVYTKEAPKGIVYTQEGCQVVVRILGNKVLIDGHYDIYCPPATKLPKLLSNPCKIGEVCSKHQVDELWPLFEAAEKIIPSLAPEEPGREVIILSPEMVEKIGADGTDKKGAYILIRDEWDDNPESELTRLYSGDIFLVSNEAKARGYRIGKEEFFLTHRIDD